MALANYDTEYDQADIDLETIKSAVETVQNAIGGRQTSPTLWKAI